ncbi:MAG TPA: hypothetical protein PLX35_07470 [Cyclobacteriaceae bacterium]|nr:hypothetical protein [Cyclobacteriaceae bacterium]
MTFDNENHIYYIYRLIGKIKFHEIDEIELRDFVNSPWGTEILKLIEEDARGKYKFIAGGDSIIPDRAITLILNRISDWEPSSKQTARKWTENQTRKYLMDMIEPYKHTDDILDRMTIELKKRIKE